MDWLVIALLAPLLWSVSEHIDKYLISRYFLGKTKALIFFSCVIGIFLLPFIFLYQPSVINVSWQFALIMILDGFLYISYLFPYFAALKRDDASTVIPIFQTIPVFTWVLAFFILGETLTTNQLLASALIILGAIGISLKFNRKRGISLKKEVFFFMIFASLIIAVNGVVFKLFAISVDFWTAMFWQSAGFAVLGFLLLFFVKGYKEEVLAVFKRHGHFAIGINLFNEIINTIGVVVFNFATLLAPITLVYVINGFNPVFTLLFGLIFTIFLPKMEHEDIRGKVLLQKVLFIALIFVGAYLLNL